MLIGRRLKSSSPDHSLPIVLAIAVCGCAFAIGLLLPETLGVVISAQTPKKTEARVLPTGAEESPAGGAWTGLNDPADGQIALPPSMATAARATRTY